MAVLTLHINKEDRTYLTLHKKAYRGLRSEREQVQVGNYRRESCANGGDKKFPMTGLVARASSVVLCGGVWS